MSYFTERPYIVGPKDAAYPTFLPIGGEGGWNDELGYSPEEPMPPIQRQDDYYPKADMVQIRPLTETIYSSVVPSIITPDPLKLV